MPRSFAFAALLVVAFLTSAFAWPGTRFTSNLFIAPHQEFVLGDADKGAYRGTVENKTSRPVGLRVESKSTNVSTSLGTLAGKAKIKITVTADQTVFIANASDQEAHLVVKLNRAPAGMGYRDL